MEQYMDDFRKMMRLMMGFSAFQTLVSGCELELFPTLSTKPGLTRDELAKRIGLTKHSARVLLLACCTYGLTERRDDGRYYNTSMAEMFLTNNSVFPIVPFTKYCNVVNYQAFQHLTESLKKETNAGLQTIPGDGDGLYKRLAQSPHLEKMFQDAMAPKDRSSRTLLFDAPELGQVKHLLDVGGGPGLIDGLLKQEHPGLQITLFDLPSVCESATRAFKEKKLGDFTTHPGDFFNDPFPKGHDAVLFSHVLEIFSEEKIKKLLTKAFQSLPKGGKTFVYGMSADDMERGSDMAAWGSLYFLGLASGEGMMYPVSDYQEWFKSIGYSSVTARRNDFENMIIIATK